MDFSDVKIDLEKSNYINHRAECMKTLQIPKLSEAKAILGEPLAKIVFDECDKALKVDFGLEPPLKGALGELWVSPSDLLVGKIALKPPYTRKHIQALTHEGILSIGADIEQKFLEEVELEKEKALNVQKKNLLDSFEDSIKAEIKDVEARERAACQREIERLTQEFENTLLEALDNLENKLRSEYESLIQNQEKSLEEIWEKKLEDEVNKTVKTMTEEFLEELSKQEDILTSCFKYDLSKVEVKRQFDLGLQAAKFELNLNQIKHKLECHNIANMMYILCMERRKCCDEKVAIEKHYKHEIEKLKLTICDKEKALKEREIKMMQHIREVALRETCILEILKQFQKFINFALKSVPTQAEFLLSVERMMAFELTDTIIKSNLGNLVPCQENMAWRTSETYPTSKKNDKLEVEDFHNCFKELPPPILEEPEYLPAFHYNNKLYVREDFRNMMSQGIEITPSNELWNNDVEILMETLRQSVTPTPKDSVSKKSSKKSLKSRHGPDSRLQFKQEKPRRVSLEDKSQSNIMKKQTSEKASIKVTASPPTTIDYNKIGIVEREPILLATKSSLELLLNKGSVKYVGGSRRPSEEQHIDELPLSIIDVEFEEMESTDTVRMVTPEKHEIEGSKKNVKEERLSHGKRASTISKGSVKMIKQHEPRTVQGGSEKLPADLALDVRDSILNCQLLLRKKAEGGFDITPKDSLEIKRASIAELKRNASKLATTRNSLEMIRQSKLKLQEPSPFCIKKDPARSKSNFSWNGSREKSSNICCDKCEKSSHSEELIDNIELEKIRKRSSEHERSIKISNIEIINITENQESKSTVAINDIPIILEDVLDDHLDKLPKLYEKKIKSKPASVKKSVKNRIHKPSAVAKVLGDRNGREYLQDIDEFTNERIHSFISLIRDHPNLLRTFTACTR